MDIGERRWSRRFGLISSGPWRPMTKFQNMIMKLQVPLHAGNYFSG
jgi:hypothetical protein